VSEFDSLIEGYPGLDDPANDPGPLTETEAKTLAEVFETDEPPIEEGDWPEEESVTSHGMTVSSTVAEALDEILGTELRALKADQRPEVGKHYVIFGGVPKPVLRSNLSLTEDEFVRSNLDVSDTLKDHDGQRQVRADRTLRMRYRGYVCGEMSSL
jgi:hypothetical protein